MYTILATWLCFSCTQSNFLLHPAAICWTISGTPLHSLQLGSCWLLFGFEIICYFLYLLMVCLKEGLGLPWYFLITICLQLISGVIFPMYLQMLCVSFWIVSLTLTNPHPHSSYHWAGFSAHYLLQLFGCGWPSWVFILAHISRRDTQVLVAVPYVHYLLFLKTFSHIIQPKWHPYVLALEPFALEQ